MVTNVAPLVEEKKVAFPESQIDDYVKHIFREHNQEADHLANLGAEGQRKVTVERGNNTENWKAVRGFCDDSTKKDGRSVSGVVIKGMDRDKVITISEIAVPLKTSTAMAAEAVGASVQTGILDLVLEKPSAWKPSASVSTTSYSLPEKARCSIVKKSERRKFCAHKRCA